MSRGRGERTPVFFDLDGTLADSAGGIIASLEHAISACGVEAATIDWRAYIGPPLPQMLAAALPNLAAEARAAIVAAYRDHYAASGMFMTTVFPGVRAVLQLLSQRGSPVYVVTNKPQGSAEAVVRHLELDLFVNRVVGGDPTGKVTKPERAAALVAEERLSGGVFVGDGLDDLHAAERISARFVLAGWGYGTRTVRAMAPHVELVARPEDLLQMIEEAG
jgi:phosphoglycolate phosphatase